MLFQVRCIQINRNVIPKNPPYSCGVGDIHKIWFSSQRVADKSQLEFESANQFINNQGYLFSNNDVTF